ncbi:MAG: GNAT family N-acetyltransferase [Paraclostridium sp.]
MIIKLDESYHSQLIRYLQEEADFNMFILGDIDSYGYDKCFFDVWAQIDSLGKFRGVLVKYFNNLILYSKDKYNVVEFANLINDLNYDDISGKEEVLIKLEPYIDCPEKRVVNFSVLKNIEMLRQYRSDMSVKRIRFGKINKVAKLYEVIDEFETPSPKSIKNGLKSGRGYCVEENRKVVAMAKSTSENSTHAMVVGVATHPNYRNKGYASKCMIKLCKNLLREGKQPCLFYDNEIAGKMYRKLGFTEIGKWSMYSK